jgi:hypothetical protein
MSRSAYLPRWSSVLACRRLPGRSSPPGRNPVKAIVPSREASTLVPDARRGRLPHRACPVRTAHFNGGLILKAQPGHLRRF